MSLDLRTEIFKLRFLEGAQEILRFSVGDLSEGAVLDASAKHGALGVRALPRPAHPVLSPQSGGRAGSPLPAAPSLAPDGAQRNTRLTVSLIPSRSGNFSLLRGLKGRA